VPEGRAAHRLAAGRPAGLPRREVRLRLRPAVQDPTRPHPTRRRRRPHRKSQPPTPRPQTPPPKDRTRPTIRPPPPRPAVAMATPRPGPDLGHPCPLLRRPWQSLDGLWDFAIDDDGRWSKPADVAFAQQIRVPFAPETPASGV